MQTTRHHPKALPYLFLTEMWERFGFYVVQGMLVLYMTKAYGYTDNQSYAIQGIFSALAYISPMIGGLLADRLLGFKTAIVWGGIFLILGYAMLAMTWAGGFYISLATIIVGNGLFKPNISSLLGALYPPGDTARDSGFTIFYMGINIGVLLAGLSSGLVQEHFGWHAGFALSSIGLILGLCTFGIGIKAGDIRYPFTPTENNPKWLSKPWLIVYCLAAILLISFLLRSTFLSNWLLPVVGIFLLIFIFKLAANQTEEHRKNLFTLIVLIISSIIFWAIFLQMFSSANLYIDRVINKTVFGFNIPTTAFYTLESIFVILLGPLFVWGWQSLNQSNRNPSPVLKFVAAIFFLGLSALVLAISTLFSGVDHLVNPLWIVLSYFLLTIGEMLLSPIGLAAITLLSPPNLAGLMMGIWFVSLGYGGYFAGHLAKLASIPEFTEKSSMLFIYRNAFLNFSYLAFGMAMALFVVYLLLRRTEKEGSKVL